MKKSDLWKVIGLSFFACFVLGLISMYVGSLPIFLMVVVAAVSYQRWWVNKDAEKRARR